MTGLHIVGAILTEWLLIAGEISEDWQYYVWAFIVVVLWSEAVNSRDPKLYPKRVTRILYFSLVFVMFFFVNKSILILQDFQLPIPPPS
ncbi:MAG: hypothetical protein IH859_02365 [Chloroflexi bacterium]|nr:hypothetical protein [Chloroflexota bacterium]